MDKKEIRRVITTRLKIIEKSCRRIEKNYGDEDIHAFRIEVKKLRAFLRLVSLELEEHKQARLPNTLKKMNIVAGDILDIHLHIIRINEAIPQVTARPQHYTRFLQRKIRSKKKELGKILEQKPLTSIRKKIKNSLPGNLSPETIKKFLNSKFNSTEILITGLHDEDEDMHSIRKNLKDILYDVKVLKDEVNTASFNSLLDEQQLKIIELLTQKLGNFNDMSIALQFMEPTYLEKLNVGEKSQLLGVREKWLQEKEESRQYAITSLKESYPALLVGDTENDG